MLLSTVVSFHVWNGFSSRRGSERSERRRTVTPRTTYAYNLVLATNKTPRALAAFPTHATTLLPCPNIDTSAGTTLWRLSVFVAVDQPFLDVRC